MEISLFRLFNVANSGLVIMKCFYALHRSLCQVRVGFRLCKDLPFNREVLFFAFKLPDVLAKFCVVLVRFVVERHLVVSEPSFKFCGSQTYVCFGFAGRHDLGLVNNSFREAISF